MICMWCDSNHMQRVFHVSIVGEWLLIGNGRLSRWKYRGTNPSEWIKEKHIYIHLIFWSKTNAKLKIDWILTNIQNTIDMIPTGKRVSRDIITSAVRTPSLNKSFLQASWKLMKSISLYFSVTTSMLLDGTKPSNFQFSFQIFRCSPIRQKSNQSST